MRLNLSITKKLKRGKKPYKKILSLWIWMLKPVPYKTKVHSMLISLEQQCSVISNTFYSLIFMLTQILIVFCTNLKAYITLVTFEILFLSLVVSSSIKLILSPRYKKFNKISFLSY